MRWLLLSLVLLAACQSTSITSFEECAEAGNPVLESYPRQCITDGEKFVEQIDEPGKLPEDSENLAEPIEFGCELDTDCPAVHCIRAPCPAMACVNNECVQEELECEEDRDCTENSNCVNGKCSQNSDPVTEDENAEVPGDSENLALPE